MSDDYDNVQWDTPSRDPFPSFYSEDFTSTNPVIDGAIESTTLSFANTGSNANGRSQYSPTTLPPQELEADDVVQGKPMSVLVEDPQKRDGSYITYLVSTTTSVKTFSSSNPRPVRRRFKDFVWLHSTLSLEYPIVVIPPLPDKHRMEYIRGDRFGAEFIERRRLGLQWLLNRIARHPLLQQSQCTRLFLESPDFKNDKRAHAKMIPRGATVLETLSERIFRPFSKVKKPDERFIEMKESVDKLEDNLKTVGRLFIRIGKRQVSLEKNYTDFAGSVRGLSVLETSVDKQLRQFAKVTEAYTSAMKAMTSNDDNLFLNWVHELSAYCHAVREQLHERDQKQIEFEELTTSLQTVVHERERILYPGRNLGDRGSGSYITELVADKMNEVRGTDAGSGRQERLVRLEKKITELQEHVARANDSHNNYSAQMIEEFDTFQKSKMIELKEGLTTYADLHIGFYEKGLGIWEGILPILTDIEINEDNNAT